VGVSEKASARCPHPNPDVDAILAQLIIDRCRELSELVSSYRTVLHRPRSWLRTASAIRSSDHSDRAAVRALSPPPRRVPSQASGARNSKMSANTQDR